MRGTNIVTRFLCFFLGSLSLLAASCMSDDESEEPESYCYIKSVKLGSLKRTIHTKDSLGNDSVYYTSYSGTYFPMTIDQHKLTIENRDSLLYESKVTSVLVTISFDGDGMGWRSAVDTTEAWTTYNSTDSLDLTHPLQLKVVAADQIHSRIYTLKLNIHQQQGDSLYWHHTDTTEHRLGFFNEMRATTLGNTVMVLGKNSAQVVQMAHREATGSWTIVDTNLPSSTIVESLLEYRDTLYVSTSDGMLFLSSDGTSWTQLGSTFLGQRLVAVTDKGYYTLANGQVFASTDAIEWNVEKLDTGTEWLPDSRLCSRFYQQDNGNYRILMCGARSSSPEEECVVWSKMWFDSQDEAEAEWVYFTLTSDNRYPCPSLECLTLLPYDGYTYAIGGAGKNHQALDNIYISKDHGITWKADPELHLPFELKGVRGPLTATVDENDVIWLIANGQIWRGRLNRLGFARN